MPGFSVLRRFPANDRLPARHRREPLLPHGLP